MDQDTFSKYVANRYEQQIAWYDGKAAVNQITYRWLQWIIIVLAAITPILIEFSREPWLPPGFSHLPTITAAAVAILTSGLKTFGYQENWINYRTTCETLRKEKYLFDARAGEYGEADDREALFVERVESMIARENTMWISTHKPERRSHENGDGGKRSDL